MIDALLSPNSRIDLIVAAHAAFETNINVFTEDMANTFCHMSQQVRWKASNKYVSVGAKE